MSSPEVTIVHHLPWRIRLFARTLRGQPRLCEAVARSLASDADGDEVSVRPSTGSVVLVRRGGDLDPQVVAGLLAAAIARGLEAGQAEVRDRVPSGHSRLADATVLAVRAVNDHIADALDGGLDLRVLVPAGLLAWAALEVSWTGRLTSPPWSTLVWWAYSSFGNLNAQHPLQKPSSPLSG